MLTLIASIISAILVTVFTVANPQEVHVSLLFQSWDNVPLYIIVVAAFFIGVSISWVISFIHGIFTTMTIRGKNQKIKSVKQELAQLTKRIHQLELENVELQKNSDLLDDKSL